MLYEIAHVVKDKFGTLWNGIEWINEILFFLRYNKRLKCIPSILKELSNDTYMLRMTEEGDAVKLTKFFKEQPTEAYRFFNPHGFDVRSLEKVLRNRAFLTFVATEGDNIVGYFFLHSFANGKGFRGKIVDYRKRNLGIAKLMGVAASKVAACIGLRVFTTISPENYASLASTRAVNDIKIVKTLKNGYYYIECTPKESI